MYYHIMEPPILFMGGFGGEPPRKDTPRGGLGAQRLVYSTIYSISIHVEPSGRGESILHPPSCPQTLSHLLGYKQLSFSDCCQTYCQTLKEQGVISDNSNNEGVCCKSALNQEAERRM
jgi:hypothetical protein